jgi:hypothetical protein
MGSIVSVHIQFLFDKSPRNFNIRKFQNTKDTILDPMTEAVSCMHGAGDLLQLPEYGSPLEPLDELITALHSFVTTTSQPSFGKHVSGPIPAPRATCMFTS